MQIYLNTTRNAVNELFSNILKTVSMSLKYDKQNMLQQQKEKDDDNFRQAITA